MKKARIIEAFIVAAVLGGLPLFVNYVTLTTWIRIIIRGCIIGGCGAGGWDGNGMDG